MRAVPLLFVALVVGLSACGGGSDSSSTTAEQGGSTAPATTTAPETTAPTSNNAPAPSGEAVRSGKVSVVDYSFSPTTVTIQAGGKVIWKNDGQQPHTATADDGSFDTGTIDPGKLKSESFKDTGTFTYICSIHPQMKGTVKVVD
jgi:plastocyanin